MATVTKKQAILEGVKEFLRLVVIAAVSAGLAAAAAYFTNFNDPMVVVIGTTFLSYIIKAWDKYIHKSDATPSNGVVPF